MSRQVTKLHKPRVSLVPFTDRHGSTHMAWRCGSKELKLFAYSGTPQAATRLYFNAVPNHIYRSFY